MKNQYLYEKMQVHGLEDFEHRFIKNTKPTKEQMIHNQLIHQESIFLLSHLATNNNVGIIGAKRILTYEFLKTIMMESPSTGKVRPWKCPYYIKRVYLRYLYEVYIKQQGDINTDFKIYKLVDIIDEIVNPELLNFKDNLYGLMEIQYPQL